MLVKILSDIHFHPMSNNFRYVDHGERVCILAGDIAEGMRGVNWAVNNIPFHIDVLYVPGNHEYYGNEYYALNQKFIEHNAKNTHVTVMLNSTVEIHNIVFAGTTLWTDFNVYDNKYQAMKDWKDGLNDHSWIKFIDRHIEANDILSLHSEALEFISKANADVLITHHAPKQSEASRWRKHPLTPGFITDIPADIHSKFKLHVHGHTHTSFDYVEDYGTRVICNPKGYFMESSTFNEELVINI